MEVSLSVNNFTKLPREYPNSELESLTNQIYSNIKINRYIGDGFNIFSAKYLNNISSAKGTIIIENFYNDKYFFLGLI
ncbi:hypothetical protein PL321_04305 [Caloramator sp. mosi_1]|uniref:hypothetical protein n=1 Tax=Caloramator sp. mosi_1 TaxID=3023090 RepID=UPI00235DC6FA|nr:hypothetical protein [Caloramator sp. mosi_1]WDC84841.1 hypothetical protein PL321_04305 [Caloramator sp. mosi_1]